jgi:hypothetical protein
VGGFALPYDFLSIVIAGFFSCVALDMFGRLLLILFKIPEPSWDVVGRWVFYMVRQGAVFNPQISYAKPINHEVKIGWAFHYFIAVVWAVAFYIPFISYPLFELSYRNGLVFGALTTLAPLFIFMPFTGQGMLARKTQMPYLTSLILLVRHSVFGLAMLVAFKWFH